MNDASLSPRTSQRAECGIETHIALLPDINALQAHQAPWFALWREVADATPFQAPAWLLCWALHYAPDRTGAIAATAGGRWLAALPYFIWNGVVWLAGTGVSDYGDALVGPRATGLSDALLEALAGVAHENDCRRIDLRQLRPDSPLLSAATPAVWRSEIMPGEPCMALPLHGAEGLGEVSRRWRRNIAYAQRRLGRAGAWTLQRVPADDAAQAAEVLRRLHERRWNARNEPSGLFADPLLREFLRDVIPRLGSASLLRMYTLELDQRPIATTFAMRAPGATYFYATGFDPAWSRCSPGLLSIAAAIRGAADEGDRTLHFLRGREGYKHHLGASEHATCRRVLRRTESH